MQHIDIYSDEAVSFEADVNLLIRNTLHGALAHLSATADAELADIKTALNKATDYKVGFEAARRSRRLTYDYFSMIRSVTRADGTVPAATLKAWTPVAFPLAFIVYGETETIPWEDEGP